MFTWSGRIRTLAAVALAGVVLGWSAGADALTIELFDTGEGVGVGSADIHYTMTGPVSGAVALAGHPVWAAAPAGTHWIGPAGGDLNNVAPGTYAYALDFDLTAMDVGTASISGSWASDNGGEIFLNGVSTGITRASVVSAPWEFQSLAAFTISSGFVTGMNTLEFRIDNTSFGPTGLLVAGLTGSADAMPVPEPGVALLVGVGLIGLGVARRRS
jgi:hypothetical protein